MSLVLPKVLRAVRAGADLGLRLVAGPGLLQLDVDFVTVAFGAPDFTYAQGAPRHFLGDDLGEVPQALFRARGSGVGQVDDLTGHRVCEGAS